MSVLFFIIFVIFVVCGIASSVMLKKMEDVLQEDAEEVLRPLNPSTESYLIRIIFPQQ